VAFPAPDATMPVNDSALQELLAAHGVKDAYASYWIAYRVTWCHDHNIGYQAWHLGSFTVVQPATKVTPGMLPHQVLY